MRVSSFRMSMCKERVRDICIPVDEHRAELGVRGWWRASLLSVQLDKFCQLACPDLLEGLAPDQEVFFIFILNATYHAGCVILVSLSGRPHKCGTCELT